MQYSRHNPGKRRLRHHQRGHRRYDRNRTFFEQRAQHTHPLPHQIAAGNIRLIKDQILARIHHRPAVVKPIFCTDFPRSFITESNDDFLCKTIAQSIYHMKLLGIIQPGKGNMPFSSVQKCFSLFKLRQFPKRSCQYLHAMPSPLFARYTRSSLHPDLFPESSAPLHRLPPKPASSAPAPPDQNVPAHSPQGRSLPVFPRRRP